MRYLPRNQNSGAANRQWTGFCNKYDGGIGNGQYRRSGDDRKEINRELVSLGAYDIRSKHGTTTTLYFAQYTRAVFEMTFDNAALRAEESNLWLLNKNPCWPEKIVPNDPGFVLMKDDKYYNRQPSDWRKRVRDGLYKSDKIPTDIMKYAQDVGYDSKRDIAAIFEDESEVPQLSGRSLERIDDSGSLVLREANFSRRFSEEEVERDVQVIQCNSKDCSEELAARKNLDDGALVSRGETQPAEPHANAEAKATPQATTVITKVDERSAASPILPKRKTSPAD